MVGLDSATPGAYLRHMADLTTAQVAERTGVSTRTIHRMVASGELRPTSKFPGYRGGFLFSVTEVRRAFPNVATPEQEVSR